MPAAQAPEPSVRVRTAVIPAAGFGTRFLPASKAVPKPLATLVDRPAIQWVVEEAVRAGIERVVVVLSRGGSLVEDHFDEAPELEAALEEGGKTAILERVRAVAGLAELSFVRQGRSHGLGHAVGVAHRAVGDEPFAVLLPDDILPTSSTLLGDMVKKAEETGKSVLALQRIPGPAIASKGVVALDGDDVVDVVEKPKYEDAPSDLAVIGRYVFTAALWPALESLERGALGEIQLTDAIKAVCRPAGSDLTGGLGVTGLVFEHGYYDVGNHLDYLTATVEMALDHDELGGPFRERLAAILERRG